MAATHDSPGLLRAYTVVYHYHAMLVCVAVSYWMDALGRGAVSLFKSSKSDIPIGIIVSVPFAAAGILLVIDAIRHAYQLCLAIGRPRPIAVCAALLLPCFNLISIWLLWAATAEWFGRHGVKMGLLGPSPEAMSELTGEAPVDPDHPERDESYVRDARASGMDDNEIIALLVAAGWSEHEATRWVAETPLGQPAPPRDPTARISPRNSRAITGANHP